MRRAALYVRVSTVDQHPETQLTELRQYAANRNLRIVGEYIDHGFSGVKARRPELDRMTDDARRHRFDVTLVWSCDRLARSTKHLIQTLDELAGLGIQFLSQREAIDTEGALGSASVSRLMKEASEGSIPPVLNPAAELARQAGVGL